MNLFKINNLKMTIHPIFIGFMLSIIALGYLEQFFVLFFSVTGHEMAHILTARIFGVRIKRLMIYPIGETAIMDGMGDISKPKKIIIILAGPFFSLGMCIFSKLFANNCYIADINFCIFLFNVLPIYPLDGGRLICELLKLYQSNLRANLITLKIGKVFICGLFLVGLIQVILYPYNISIICIAQFLKLNIRKEEIDIKVQMFKKIFDNIY